MTVNVQKGVLCEPGNLLSSGGEDFVQHVLMGWTEIANQSCMNCFSCSQWSTEKVVTLNCSLTTFSFKSTAVNRSEPVEDP